ncbi:MAG: hypothetical protein PHX57_12045 [Desulfobulbaceae bacterium]|jgi:hypothetical protein|nr:hypothetical protein [Desulfobulbaceae bacterium]
MGPVFLFVVKPPPQVVDPERFTRIVVHFLLVQKTNQKRTPVPFDPPGSLCSSGVAENLRFEEQIFLPATPCGASANGNGQKYSEALFERAT